MNRYIKTTLKVLACLILLAILGIGGLVVYAKYFYNQDIDITQYYADELPIKQEAFEKEFEEIHQTTLENYSLYASKHLNMDSLHHAFQQRVSQADNPIEFGNLLKEYVAALHAGHASVYLKDYTADYAPSYIEGRVFIDRPNEYLTANGFADKDEIIAINGVLVPQWITDNEKYTPASTEECRRLMTARKAFRSWSDTAAVYRIVREQDTLDLKLALKKETFFPKEEQPNTVEWKVLQDSIGYINIRSMMNPVTDEFEKAYRQLKALPYLIIDVRNNGGGNSGNGKKLCEYLVRKPQPHCVSPDTEITPRTDAYQGKLFLLTSTYTFSAAESFALDLKESGNATLIGEPTGGDTGNRPQTFQTSGGIFFRLPTREPSSSPQGFPMEGKGIPPHHEVHQTVSDFMQNRDTVLESALQLITNNE